MKNMDEFEITCERYVGYIDIMGFKNIVAKTPHSEVYKMMLKIYECKNLNENIKWDRIEKKIITTTNYSDSIMIYSKDKSRESFNAFINTISGIIEDMLIEGIPFKGAVSFGMMTLDSKRSIFFGQPLIDSYLLQEELYLYGIIVHASFEKEMIRHKIDKNRLFLMKYLCPLKKSFNNIPYVC